MFKSISWQDFITGTAIILGSYYIISALVLYLEDVYRWFMSEQKRTEQSDIVMTRPSNVMGAIKHDPPKKYEQVVEAQDVVVGDRNEKKQQSEDSLLFGSVSDLLQEVKVLSRVIKENGGAKEEGAAMFNSLLSNYSHLVETKYKESISVFIHQHCTGERLFDVDLNEIKSWWPGQKSQNNQNNREV